MTKQRYYAYLRVSSLKQKQNGTIDNQKLILENYDKNHPDIEISKTFIEFESSFKDRKIFNEMMQELLNSNDINGVICTKLSRFARKTIQAIAMSDEIEKADKKLILITENVDTSTPEGRFFFRNLANFNEYNADVIRENMKHGRERARKEGVKFGQPEKRINIKKARELYESGQGLKNVLKALNKEAKKSEIYDVVKSPMTLRARLIEAGVEIRPFRGKKEE